MDNNYSYAELFVSPDKLATSIEKSDVLILKSKELQNEIYEFRSILNNNKLLRDACINTPDLLCNLLEIYADDLVKESNKMKYKKEAFLMEANNYSKNPQGEVKFNLSKETISKLETNEKLAKEQSAENKDEINTELVSEDILTSTRKKDDGELLNRGEATSVTLASLGITNADLEHVFKFKHTSGTFGNKEIIKKITKDVIDTPKPPNPIPDDIHEDDTIINNNNQNNNVPNNNFNTTNNQTTSENTKPVEENKPEKPKLEKVEPNKKENTTTKEVEKENNNKNIFEKSNEVEETKQNNKVEEIKPNNKVEEVKPNNTKTFVVKPSTNQNTSNNQNIKSSSNNNYNNVFDNKNIAGGDTKPSPIPEKGIEKLPEIEKPTTHVQGTPIIRKPGTPVKEVREGTNLVVPIMGGLALGGGAAAGTKVYLSRLDNDSDEDNYDDDYEDENTEDYEVDYNDETNNKEEYLDFDNSDKPVEKYSARKTN
mgnify:CR=1 FL=1|jgi:hypothetical protein